MKKGLQKGGYGGFDAAIPLLRNIGTLLCPKPVLVAVLGLVLMAWGPAVVHAANSTTAGVISAKTTDATSIAVKMPYTGDDNGNSTYTVQWKLCSDGSYPGPNIINGSHTASPFRATITDLTQNTCYTIKVTYVDADGVDGGNPQEIKITSTWDNTLLHNANRFTSSTKWSTDGGWGLPGTKYGQIDCNTCHKPRATNIKGIASGVTSPNAPTDNFPGSTVNFRTTWGTPNSFGDDSDNHTTSTRICEVCHSKTTHHSYNTTWQSDGRDHNNNADCSTCHPHSAGFYNATGACDSCHGYPPTTATIGGSTGLATPATGALGASPTTPGAHSAHTSTRSMACDTCHKVTIGSVMPTVSNSIQMGFVVNATNFPGWGSSAVTTGRFNGVASLNPPYTWATGNPGTSVGTGNNTCAVYCHGSTLTGGTNATAAVSWVSGSAGQACGSCHGGGSYNSTSSTPPTAGSHLVHTGNWSSGARLSCDKCHNSTVNMGHVNGNVSWGLATTDGRIGTIAAYKGSATGSTGGIAPSGAYGNCSNVYCHSNVQSGSNGTAGPSAWATVQWGNSTSGQCGTCHKGDGISGNASLMDSGSHTKHVSSSIGCATCHQGSGHNTSLHVNYAIEVDINASYGGSYNKSGQAPGHGFGSCSSVYCHSSGTGTYVNAVWGSSATGACGSCHGATHASPPATGSHAMHTQEWSSTNSAYVYQFNCYKCHKNTVTNEDPAVISTIGRSTYHLNKTTDVAFDSADPLIGTGGAAWKTSESLCANLYCHSTGKASWVTTSLLPAVYDGSHWATVSWADTGLLACTSCHGRSGQATLGSLYEGYPDYGWSTLDAGTERANSHLAQTHGKTSCSVCHYSTTVDGHIIYSNTHANGTINVNFDPTYSRWGTTAYDTNSGKRRTCSNVTCHGVESAQWGAVGSCADCHEAGAVNISGYHSRHWETVAGNATARAMGNSSTATYYKFECGTCHVVGNHPDGVIGENYADVGFNITWLPAEFQTNGVWVTGTWTTAVDSRYQKISVNGQCSNVYCHSTGIAPGTGAPTYRTIAWNTTAQNPDCGVCHNSPMTTNRHTMHASTYSYGCAECHQPTVSSNTTFADKSKHVDGLNEVGWMSGGRNSDGSAYDDIAYGCSNIYCHSRGTSNATPYDAPNIPVTWLDSPLPADCSGCHGGDATAWVTMSTNRHAAHINNAPVIGLNITCDACHSATVSGNRTISTIANHVNKQVNVAFKSLNAGASYTGSNTPGDAVGSCTSLYCHSNGKIGTAAEAYTNPAWNGTAIGCNGCHGTGNSAGYPDYASGSAGSTTANSHAKHAGIAGFSCSRCHYSVTTSGTAINGSSPASHINKNTQDVVYATGFGGNYTTVSKTCSSVYCHSNVQAPGGASGATLWGTLQWGDSTTLNCGSCHVDMSTTTDLTLGSHQRHTNSAGVATYSCSMCHGAGYAWNTVVYPTHANRNIDTSFTGMASGTTYNQAGPSNNPPGNGYGTCTTNACHGRGLRNWGYWSTLTTCEKCHGSAESIAVDNGFRDTSGSTGSAQAGTHKSHLLAIHNYTDQILCENCHIKPSEFGDPVTGVGHAGTLPATITWGRLATGAIRWGTATLAPNYAWQSGRTCSNTYCHSQGGSKETPYWGDLGYGLSCGNCHGNPPAYPHPTGTQGQNCMGCHYHVDSSNTAFKSTYRLIEGICSDRTWSTMSDCVSNGGSWTSAGTNVPGKSLHLDGRVQVTQDACLGCHSTTGDFALIGQHYLHTDNDLFLSNSKSWGSATGGTTIQLVDTTQSWSTINQFAGYYVRIANGPNQNRQYKIQSSDATSLTIWSTTSPTSWSTAITAGTIYNIRSAKLLSNDDYDDPGWIYQIAYQNGFPRYACGFCHPEDSSKHRNGEVNLDMDPTHSLPGTVKTKNWTSGQFIRIATGENVICAAVYCHSNGYISPTTSTYDYKTTPNWYAMEPWASVDRCSQCHGNSPNSGGNAGSAAHGKHNVGIHYKDTASGTYGKMATAHGDGNSTTMNCNMCHSGTVNVYSNDLNPVCAGCHNGSTASLKGNMVIDPTNTRHADGNVDIIFNTPFVLKTKAQLRDDITTVPTLNASWTRQGGYKQWTTSLDITWRTPTYSAGTCSTTSCHNGTPMQWGQAGPLECMVCHLGIPK